MSTITYPRYITSHLWNNEDDPHECVLIIEHDENHVTFVDRDSRILDSRLGLSALTHRDIQHFVSSGIWQASDVDPRSFPPTRQEQDRALILQLTAALQKASNHLDYCGYGDSWERDGTGPMAKEIEDALAAANTSPAVIEAARAAEMKTERDLAAFRAREEQDRKDKKAEKKARHEAEREHRSAVERLGREIENAGPRE